MKPVSLNLFNPDVEPTKKQLSILMKEVAKEAKEKAIKVENELIAEIDALIKAKYGQQTRKKKRA